MTKQQCNEIDIVNINAEIANLKKIISVNMASYLMLDHTDFNFNAISQDYLHNMKIHIELLEICYDRIRRHSA